MTSFTNTKLRMEREAGFTLLELLIVISIIAILSVALVFLLNPAEALKKSRDARRIADLKTLKTAIGVMLTSTSTPSLDNFAAAGGAGSCLTVAPGGGTLALNSTAKIAYSTTSVACTGAAPAAGTDAATTFGGAAAWCSAGTAAIDGNGWIKIVFKNLTSGSPISNLPVDPTNTVNATTPAKTDLVYRYACQNATSSTVGSGKPGFVFEVNAVLESNAYTVDDNRMTKDGGDNDDKYEIGNSLNLLPITAAAF
ncbi:MAG: prepilin-type N-terminal cleavage/methylation domain-containing protein [Candidatus Pacebacteria bacterium]|nr:prepilin-type N-terminal cleavage/methylation domain-containing protein [Candidatus Paceibacterota bacterium]